jgi:hypothetical protein
MIFSLLNLLLLYLTSVFVFPYFFVYNLFLSQIFLMSKDIYQNYSNFYFVIFMSFLGVINPIQSISLLVIFFLCKFRKSIYFDMIVIFILHIVDFFIYKKTQFSTSAILLFFVYCAIDLCFIVFLKIRKVIR